MMSRMEGRCAGNVPFLFIPLLQRLQMTMTYFPNYRDGSLVNLMSSLLQASDGQSPYAPLALLPPDEIKRVTHLVLLVLDGFGYEFLMRQRDETFFRSHLRGKITSVFPSTTAAGITTFLTGLAPQQHAATGWFMHLKELGCVATTLRFQPRCCEASLRRDGVEPSLFFGGHSVFTQMRRQTYSLVPQELLGSDYDSRMNPCPQKLGYSSLPDCLRQLAAILSSRHEKTFTYAYWDGIDDLSHRYGTRSIEVIRHLFELSDAFEAFVAQFKGADAAIIVTADHGLIDSDMAHTIQMKDHPALYDTLALPLCAEPRAAFCYVRPFKVAQFERYVREHFEGVCDLHRSEDLLKQGVFGLFEPHPRLADRIGDYALIMRDNYVIKDVLPGEKEKFHVGNHGGVSAEEMFVPLVVIRPSS